MPGPGRVNGNINGGLIQHNATQRGRPLNAWCLLHAPVNIYARDEKWIHALSLGAKVTGVNSRCLSKKFW